MPRSVVLIQLLLSPKEVAKKSARFSKRGKESSTFINSSNFVTRLAQCVVFGASGFVFFRLAMQGFGGLPQRVNFLLAYYTYAKSTSYFAAATKAIKRRAVFTLNHEL